jgi:hypothetical protein
VYVRGPHTLALIVADEFRSMQEYAPAAGWSSRALFPRLTIM